MKHVTFVTTNDIKYDSAARLAQALGFSLDRATIELDELQGDGEAIARHKAQQAWERLQKPVVVTDDTWIIPALNGFPGAYMKMMNQWFTPEDFLRLTKPLQDRRIILQQHTVYQDSAGQHYFVADLEGTLLTEIRGHSQYPHLAITSFDGINSRAETLAKGQPLIDDSQPTAWHDFAEWFVES